MYFCSEKKNSIWSQSQSSVVQIEAKTEAKN